jgi:glutathione S-transferase
MDAALESGPWQVGAQCSLADIIVAPLIHRMADHGFSSKILDPEYPRVAEWYARMQARPAF